MSLTFDGVTAAEPTSQPFSRPGGMRFQSSAQAGARPSPVCGGKAVRELTALYNRKFTTQFEIERCIELHPQFTDPEFKMSSGAWDLLAARYNFRVYQRVSQKVPGPIPSLENFTEPKGLREEACFPGSGCTCCCAQPPRIGRAGTGPCTPSSNRVHVSRRGKHGCRPHEHARWE